MAKKRSIKTQIEEPKPTAETQAVTPKRGAETIVSSIAHITGIEADQIPSDLSLGWFDRAQRTLAAHGWNIEREDRKVSVRDPHVGLFLINGELNAAVFAGDTAINNPTDTTVTAGRITQRIRVTRQAQEGTQTNE